MHDRGEENVSILYSQIWNAQMRGKYASLNAKGVLVHAALSQIANPMHAPQIRVFPPNLVRDGPPQPPPALPVINAIPSVNLHLSQPGGSLAGMAWHRCTEDQETYSECWLPSSANLCLSHEWVKVRLGDVSCACQEARSVSACLYLPL